MTKTQNLFKMAASMRQMLSRLSTAKEGLKVPGRLKTGLPKKIGDYLSNMYRDYRAATVDVFTDMKERPFKATFYIASLSAIGYMWSQAPDEENFEIELVNASNDLLLLSNLTRNQGSDGHVQKLTALQNAGVLRFMNLGVCSLIWEDNFDKRVAMYDAKCDYLAVSWRELPDRIRDVGFLGRWHYLSKAMTDYDINEFEFQNASSG